MPLPMSRSALDALGKRLRRGEVGERDWGLLREVLDCYQASLDAVQERLGGLGLVSTSRVKSTGTLIDKLARGTSFKSVQDVAGARIIVDGGCPEQNLAVQRIVAHFGPDSRVVDRRSDPMHGYRAVHIVVRQDELPVEIKVRTGPQDIWAQAMERLADRWGRGLRYGEPLAHPDLEIVPGFTRGQLLALLDRVGDVIAVFERAQQDVPADDVAFTEFEAETNGMLEAISELFEDIDDVLG